jgi:hypothetical protein
MSTVPLVLLVLLVPSVAAPLIPPYRKTASIGAADAPLIDAYASLNRWFYRSRRHKNSD